MEKLSGKSKGRKNLACLFLGIGALALASITGYLLFKNRKKILK